MKITKTFIGVFLLTFLIGYFLIPSTSENKVITPLAAAPTNFLKTSTPEILPKIERQLTEEKIDWREEDSVKLKIKLLETGEGFHGDQVNAKSGEIWLGLFKDKERYFLRDTKLKISRVHDIVVDEEENIKTGKSVFTDDKARAVFLLKNAKISRQGEIKTVFFADETNELTELKNGSRKEFEFNGEKYILSVENKIQSDEFLGKGSKLLLSHNGKEQVLNYLKDGCNDCYWNVYWVGDLDRDGKLDFYFDLSGYYNITDKKLFLSSQAEKGKLVKYVANFLTNGC